MTGRRSLVLAAVTLLMLSAAVVAPAVAAGANATENTTAEGGLPDATPTPDPERTGPQAGGGAVPESDGDYSLSELEDDGKHYSVPSARIVPSEDRVYWLEHVPANQPYRSVSKSNNGEKYQTNTTLRTNTLWLRTIRPSSTTETVNVTVVSWEKRWATTGPNTTRKEPYATNVSTMETQVTLGPGWSLAAIDLPRHPRTHQMTMWVQGHGETARWTYSHQSAATTRNIDIDTWGDFLLAIIQYVGVPVLLGGAFVGRKVRRAVEAAGQGPGWGFAKWLAVITILSVTLVTAAYTQLAQAIVVVPYILGLWLVGVFAAYTLATHHGDVSYKGFLRPDIHNAKDFSNIRAASSREGGADGATPATDGGVEADLPGGFAFDFLRGAYEEYAVIDDRDGLSIIRPGRFVPFLARIYGARSYIEGIEDTQSRFELPGSVPDEMFLIDPRSDGIVDYEPPGFAWTWPDLGLEEMSRGKLAVTALGAFGAVGLGVWSLVQTLATLTTDQATLTVAGLGLVASVAVAKWFIEPTDGFAHIEPAPMHFRQVFASVVMLSEGISDATDLETAKRRYRMQLLKNNEEAIAELDEFDRTLMDKLAGAEVGDEFDRLGNGDEADAGDPLAAVEAEEGESDE